MIDEGVAAQQLILNAPEQERQQRQVVLGKISTSIAAVRIELHHQLGALNKQLKQAIIDFGPDSSKVKYLRSQREATIAFDHKQLQDIYEQDLDLIMREGLQGRAPSTATGFSDSNTAPDNSDDHRRKRKRLESDEMES